MGMGGRSTYQQQQQHPYALAVPSYAHMEAKPTSRLPMSIIRADDSSRPVVNVILPTVTGPPSRRDYPPPPPPWRPSTANNATGGPSTTNHLLSNPNTSHVASRFLKSSVSTPNLRSAASARDRSGLGNNGDGTSSQPNTPNSISKWLSAETWCDALIFPRPRFRVRAHQISPPESPVTPSPYAGGDPIFAPAIRMSPLNPQFKNSPDSGRKFGIVGGEPQHENIGNGNRNEREVLSDAPPITGTRKVSPTVVVLDDMPARKPPRPKSFAQDDLALLSPTPSITTVLKEGEILEQERQTWQKQATRSFANKRSRSLSRSRITAMARKNSRLALDRDGMEESELAHSFDLLASTAFHGHQLRKPNISVPRPSMSTSAYGTSTISTGHSRKSSGASNGKGHQRKDSLGKSMKTIKSTTSNICGFGDDPLRSPVDDTSDGLENALNGDKTKVISLGGRRSDAAPVDDNVMLITSNPKPPLPPPSQNVQRSTRVSPTPTERTGGSDGVPMGIAVSTPTALTPEPLAAHPYATAGRSHAPRPSDYAGPHPSSPRVTLTAATTDTIRNEVSLRHRLPPRPSTSGSNNQTPPASSHPYAVEGRSFPTLLVPQQEKMPMFAQVGSGIVREVMPDEFQYSPLTPGGSAHPSRQSQRSSALGVEEALNLAFRRESGVTAIEPSEDHASMQEAELEPEAEPEVRRSPVVGHVHAATWPRASFDIQQQTPQTPDKVDAQLSQSSSSQPSSQPSDSSKEPSPGEEALKKNSPWSPAVVSPSAQTNGTRSPGVGSQESSPETSPRALVHSEDLDDLFYKPGQRSADNSLRRTPSSELVNRLAHIRHASDKRSSMRLSSGVHESHDLSHDTVPEHDNESESTGIEHPSISSWDRRYSRMSELSQLPDPPPLPHTSNSSPGTTLPLRLPTSRALSLDQPSLLVPEDVGSSRASSLGAKEDAQEVYYRLGHVPALSTPNPVSGHSHRASSAATYFHEDSSAREEHKNVQESDKQPVSSHASLVPPADVMRASYVTSTSGESRISQLSDFPVPPTQDMMSPTSILQSFYDIPGPQRHDNINRSADLPDDLQTESRRTTFGGNEDMSGLDLPNS
ncbi:hypothetical protein BD410DRAFT_785181 [Rickenella mellea]|uniref:Uncharacterized protein n=1 Tax=Rickenella mellea TaxID=50990 RepID=A0A4Y7QDE6_9AGAM|nr:hypothetical protein BD410DRAFT_785181 [Rickenella mellea]